MMLIGAYREDGPSLNVDISFSNRDKLECTLIRFDWWGIIFELLRFLSRNTQIPLLPYAAIWIWIVGKLFNHTMFSMEK